MDIVGAFRARKPLRPLEQPHEESFSILHWYESLSNSLKSPKACGKGSQKLSIN